MSVNTCCCCQLIRIGSGSCVHLATRARTGSIVQEWQEHQHLRRDACRTIARPADRKTSGEFARTRTETIRGIREPSSAGAETEMPALPVSPGMAAGDAFARELRRAEAVRGA